MKLKILLYLIIATVLFSCGTNKNSDEVETATEHQIKDIVATSNSKSYSAKDEAEVLLEINNNKNNTNYPIEPLFIKIPNKYIYKQLDTRDRQALLDGKKLHNGTTHISEVDDDDNIIEIEYDKYVQKMTAWKSGGEILIAILNKEEWEMEGAGGFSYFVFFLKYVDDEFIDVTRTMWPFDQAQTLPSDNEVEYNAVNLKDKTVLIEGELFYLVKNLEETEVPKPKYIDFGKDQLAIKGKNIWVRDTTATGKVVMKLNEGDRCTVLKKSFFEIIRGDADYWYKIEFNGQQGWVFGAQTSYKNMQTPISAVSVDALWDSFKKHKKNWVDNENMGNPEEYGKYIYTENLNKIKVVWEGEGASSFEYSLSTKSTQNLCIINETAKLGGAAGSLNKWSTFLGIKSSTYFKMDTNRFHKFDGKAVKLIKVNEGEYILFTYQDSGEGIVMIHESYYNVFYINTSKNTVRMIESELGLVNRNETEYNARNGYAILDTSLEFTPNTTSFTLNEERHTMIEDENGYPSYTPFDTLSTTYTWDAKKKKYAKE